MRAEPIQSRSARVEPDAGRVLLDGRALADATAVHAGGLIRRRLTAVAARRSAEAGRGLARRVGAVDQVIAVVVDAVVAVPGLGPRAHADGHGGRRGRGGAGRRRRRGGGVRVVVGGGGGGVGRRRGGGGGGRGRRRGGGGRRLRRRRGRGSLGRRR